MMRSARVQFAALWSRRFVIFFPAACTLRVQFSTQIGRGNTTIYATRLSQRSHQLLDVQAPSDFFSAAASIKFVLTLSLYFIWLLTLAIHNNIFLEDQGSRKNPIRLINPW
jgi:hypothetical protein